MLSAQGFAWGSRKFFMKKNLRFYFALFFAKGTSLVLRLIGRKGTSMPGSWAIILCPDFIGHIDKPKTIIGITGTNGKTTVSNLIEDVLTAQGKEFICNREGSNVPTGIASALIANSTLSGKQKKQLAVFEIDERSTPRLFPYLTPDILAVTNLFRDSYRRNAHTEFIFDILDRNIPKETLLLLNGDDPLCTRLRESGTRRFFGMLPLPFERSNEENIVCDNAVCPRCADPLVYDFKRYHHIGISHCKSCGYTFPERDYLVETADRENRTLTLRMNGQALSVRLLDENPINIYNQLCALAVLVEHGCGLQTLQSVFETLRIAESRLTSARVGDKTIIRCLAKGQNPVACSRAFDMARALPGLKCVVLFLDDEYDAEKSVENTAWLWDTDFEFLNHESINQILVGGARHHDTYLRLLMAGVSPALIQHMESTEAVISHIDFTRSDTFVICHDIYLIGFSENIKNVLAQKMEGRHAD